MGTLIMASRFLLSLLLVALLSAAVFAEDKLESVDDAKAAEDADDGEEDPAKQGAEELAKMDSNKDGKADLGEVTEYMKKEFYGPEDIKEDNLTPDQVNEKAAADAKEYLDELDKNKDTFLDLDEFTAHYKDDADDVDSELDEAGDEDAGDEDATEDEADADEE